MSSQLSPTLSLPICAHEELTMHGRKTNGGSKNTILLSRSCLTEVIISTPSSGLFYFCLPSTSLLSTSTDPERPFSSLGSGETSLRASFSDEEASLP